MPVNMMIWISWEKQQRTINMAKIIGAELVILNYEKYGFFRHAFCTMHTILILYKCKNKVVFVQNPSIFLTVIACFFKKYIGFKLVVDRHSNFMLGHTNEDSIRYKIFHMFSDYTLKCAEITIVTNSSIANRVLKVNGYPAILPDPLPDLKNLANGQIPLHQEFSILFPCSWSMDEPIMEVAEVCKALHGEIIIYVTGKPKPYYKSKLYDLPPNFIKTGYLEDSEYFTLMAKCHIVMPLTKYSELLVCGGYEGISLVKPLILGNSPALMEYFYKGAVFTACSPGEIVSAITKIKANYEFFKNDASCLREELLVKWPTFLNEFKRKLTEIAK